MIRPQFARLIAGRQRRARRTPLRTLTSKKRTQSESEIVDQNIDAGMTPDQFFDRHRGAEIAGKSHSITTGCGLHFADRLVDAGLCAAGNNDARTFPG